MAAEPFLDALTINQQMEVTQEVFAMRREIEADGAGELARCMAKVLDDRGLRAYYEHAARSNNRFWLRAAEEFRHEAVRRNIDGFDVQCFDDSEEIDHGIVPFPTHALPGVFRDLIEEGAAALGCPPDLIAIPLIAMTAGMIGNSQRIKLKSGWEERAILWMVTIAPPGSLKTPAQTLARKAIDKLQAEAHDVFLTRKQAYEEEIAVWESNKGGDRGPKPTPPRMDDIYLSDITMEALAESLSHRPGNVVPRDELLSWIKANDAYRGGKGGDRQSWLSMWSGVPLKVNRKNRDTLFVPEPTVSVVGGLQPALIAELADEAGAQDGFIPRILPSWPLPSMAMWTEATVKDSTVTAVFRALRTLRQSDRNDPPVLLNHEAKELFVSWFNENAAIQRNTRGLSQAFAAKLPSHLARLVLVLHCMEYPQEPTDRQVSASTMAAGIELGEYFRAHFARMLPAFNESADVASAGLQARIIRVLESEDEQPVLKSTIHRLLGGHVPMAEITDMLQAMADEDVVEVVAVPPGPKGGRPGEAWKFTNAYASKRQNVTTLYCRKCGEDLITDRERSQGVCWPCDEPEGRPF